MFKLSNEYRTILKTTEGKILSVGILMAVVWLVYLLFSWIAMPQSYQSIAAISIANVIFGRATGISLGYAANYSDAVVIFINIYIETMLVLVCYPLFIFSWNNLFLFSRFKDSIETLKKNAEKYKPAIEKYGTIGLFFFVWFPFWMTGPIIGAVIGYLMGLPHRVTLSVVLIGTSFAIAVWSFFLSKIQTLAKEIDPNAPWIIVGGIVLLILVAYFVRKIVK